MTRIRHIPGILRHLGPRWALARLRMAFEHRVGFLRRRCPARPWHDVPATASGTRVLALGRLETSVNEPEAWEIQTGGFRPFSWSSRRLGLPPDWHLNVLTGEKSDGALHWTELPDFGAGDIKGVWELSRWGWVYPLGRAYLRNGDESHARTFALLAADWLDRNPPHLGPNWKCGQEASIRLIAAAWALSAFAASPHLDDSLRRRIAALAEVTAERVEAHLDYALSQDNNHGISELAGLVTAGIVWPGLTAARRRVAKATRILDAYAERLFAPDGSFSQHSSNYHRVALDALCWTEAALRLAGQSLPPRALAAGARGAAFLHGLSAADGRVARYGADDGARILPLALADYGDYRPTLSACAPLLGGPALPPGPWQDQARLLGAEPSSAGVADWPAGSDLLDGGVHVRRRGPAIVTFRCPTRFRFRPSHADQLHLSVLVGDSFAVDDPGTYSYNLPAHAWADLASARHHNVPMVDDRDAMERATRFLWLPWLACRLERCEPGLLRASYPCAPGFHVTRAVEIGDREVVVTDDFAGDRPADLSVRWSSPRRADLARLRIGSASGDLVEEWHGSDHSTGLGVHCLRYGFPGPGWMRIGRIKGRAGKIVTVIPLGGSTPAGI